jgi:hypothetical protein
MQILFNPLKSELIPSSQRLSAVLFARDFNF